MLNALTTKKQSKSKAKQKGHKETLDVVGYIYYLDCGDGIMGVCIVQTSNYTLNMCSSLYINYTS